MPKSKRTAIRNPRSEPLIISALPRGRHPDPELGKLIDAGLKSLADLPNEVRFFASTEQLRELDKIILRQTDTLGSLILTSPLVRERVHAWREDRQRGIALTEQFASALVKAVRYHQRGKPPVDANLRAAKVQFVSELKPVLRLLRNWYSQRHRETSTQDLVAELKSSIEKTDAALLSSNLSAWLAFVEAAPRVLLDVLRNKRDKSADLFDQWLAFCTGYDPEHARQKITKL